MEKFYKYGIKIKYDKEKDFIMSAKFTERADAKNFQKMKEQEIGKENVKFVKM